VTSQFGRVLTAIRDAEQRVAFCGYNTVTTSSFIWTLSAVICGIAGALYVPQVGIINPSEMSPANSIEIAIWVAVGGRGTLLGAILGAGVVNGAKSFFTQAFPNTGCTCSGCVHPGDAVHAARACRYPSQWRTRREAGRAVIESGPPAQDDIASRYQATSARQSSTASHGVVLYLEDISVSFDGFQGAERADARDRRGRAALRDRAQRRGKTTMMDVVHRQDAARRGHGVFGQTIDLTKLTEAEIAHAGIGRKFQKPTIFEYHSVFENLELAMKADKRVRNTLFVKLTSEDRDRIAAMLERVRLLDAAGRHRRACSRTAEAVARDRHAADAGAEAVAARRAGRRHERRGDRAHRRAFPRARRRAFARRRRARHGVHREDRAQGHGAARGRRDRRGADGGRCRTTRA
jgi:hypothetical protein